MPLPRTKVSGGDREGRHQHTPDGLALEHLDREQAGDEVAEAEQVDGAHPWAAAGDRPQPTRILDEEPDGEHQGDLARTLEVQGAQAGQARGAARTTADAAPSTSIAVVGQASRRVAGEPEQRRHQDALQVPAVEQVQAGAR